MFEPAPTKTGVNGATYLTYASDGYLYVTAAATTSGVQRVDPNNGTTTKQKSQPGSK